MPLTTGEQALIKHLNKLYTEGAEARSKVSKNWDRAIKTIRGETWPERRPKYKINAVMNFLAQIVERKAALLTDSRPTIVVASRKQKDDPVSEILQKTIECILDEKSFEQKLTEFVMLEEYFGFALFNTCYDKNLDYGRGDIDMVVIDPRCFIFDPFVTRSWNLQNGEYCCLETLKPTEMLKDLNPKKADDIKSDFTSEDVKVDSLIHKLRTLFGWEKSATEKSSAIPRSIVRDWWIRDRTTRRDSKLVFPNWRHIILGGGVPIEDGANPYLDGNHPFDAMEWGFNVDSAYGINEIDPLESPQILFNKLLAGILENAILMGNGIWIGDQDALSKEDWAKLTNEPGSHVKKRPSKELRRDTPPALPAYMMPLATMLINGLEKLSGITEVTEGRRPGQVCVDDQTQCLTKRGWKFHHELISSDEIYTFDPANEKGVWSPLIGIAKYNWDDNLYKVETDRMSCAVTPNHGWLVGFTGRSKVPSTMRKPRITDKYHWTDVKYQRVEMQDINIGHFIPNEVRLSDQPPIYEDNFVELIGWIVTEGCFNITLRENGRERYRVIISQSPKVNLGKFERLANCLSKSGFKFTLHEDQRCGVVEFVIEGDEARLLMGLLPEKRMTYEFICKLSLSQLDLLYDVMLDGDGTHFDPSNTKTQDAYFSADQELADRFQMIAVLKGKATHQVQCLIDPRVKSHKKEYYTNIKKISCRREAQTKWRTLLNHLKFDHYKGIVWCPQTLTGTWVARRNGITYLTHNTSGTAIESLAMMAQTTIRLKARQLEGMIQRIGQKLIPRIFAYYTADRVFNLVGTKGKIETYLFEREKIRDLIKNDSRGMGAFQDYQFKVIPASSLAMTKWQKGLMAVQLFQTGLIDEEAALDALEFPNRDEIMERMGEKQKEMAMIAAQQGGGGGKGFGAKKAGAKLPANLLRGKKQELGFQEPQVP